MSFSFSFLFLSSFLFYSLQGLGLMEGGQPVMNSIRQAEKAAKKVEAQAHFEALRAEQAKKMALLKAEAQRKAEIQAAKEQQAPSEKDLKREPKSKWGKLTNGFKDAVLFPDGGPKSTMF